MKSFLWNMAAVLALCVFVGCEKDAGDKTSKSSQGEAKIVNTHCPIMGGKINEELTVAYKDGKVAFCCEKCDPAWAKLSDEEKAEALATKGQGKEGGDDHDKDGHKHDKDDKEHKDEKKG